MALLPFICVILSFLADRDLGVTGLQLLGDQLSSKDNWSKVFH